jgi:hypothetical protein
LPVEIATVPSIPSSKSERTRKRIALGDSISIRKAIAETIDSSESELGDTLSATSGRVITKLMLNHILTIPFISASPWTLLQFEKNSSFFT